MRSGAMLTLVCAEQEGFAKLVRAAERKEEGDTH